MPVLSIFLELLFGCIERMAEDTICPIFTQNTPGRKLW